MYPYGVGSNHDKKIEQDFAVWKGQLWSSIHEVLPDMQVIGPEEHQSEDAPMYQLIEENESLKDYPPHLDQEFTPNLSYKKWKNAKIGHIRRIEELRDLRTQELSTLLIEIEIDANDTYKMAQNMIVFPKNSATLVQKAEAYLKINGNPSVFFSPSISEKSLASIQQSFPNRAHMRTILREFIDLSGAPK